MKVNQSPQQSTAAMPKYHMTKEQERRNLPTPMANFTCPEKCTERGLNVILCTVAYPKELF